jgi:hypothetical protein
MQMFDFNAIQKPTWPVKLADDAQTVVHLSYPSLELADKLTAMSESLKEVVNKNNAETVRKAFGVVAAVMSCNEDGLTFTADELREKYHMTLLGMARFTAGYLTFLQEANEAKN